MGPRTDEVNEVASKAADEAVEEVVAKLGVRRNGKRNAVVTWSTAIATVMAAGTGLTLGLVNNCNPEPKAQATYKTLQAAVPQLSKDIKAVETRLLRLLARRERAASRAAKGYIDNKVDRLQEFTAAFLAGQASLTGSRVRAGQNNESTKKLLDLLAKKSEAITRTKRAAKPVAPMPKATSPIRKVPSMDKAQRTKGKMAF